ncbi:hypothetical protein [Vibrio sonorensis]|uniref:hypothetical protein n=1 Tax=Vibrio sonorensis TaxID=1004316 RepID=UPI001113FC01|nr:hypothetical protein [Vibrio sonorensis]
MSEDQHRHNLIALAAQKRHQTSWQKMETPKPLSKEQLKQQEQRRKDNEQALNIQARLNQLEGALTAWSTTGKGFTSQMLSELNKLRDNKLSPMIKHIAERFKKAQLVS